MPSFQDYQGNSVTNQTFTIGEPTEASEATQFTENIKCLTNAKASAIGGDDTPDTTAISSISTEGESGYKTWHWFPMKDGNVDLGEYDIFTPGNYLGAAPGSTTLAGRVVHIHWWCLQLTDEFGTTENWPGGSGARWINNASDYGTYTDYIGAEGWTSAAFGANVGGRTSYITLSLADGKIHAAFDDSVTDGRAIFTLMIEFSPRFKLL